jgi:hypothetical protein
MLKKHEKNYRPCGDVAANIFLFELKFKKARSINSPVPDITKSVKRCFIAVLLTERRKGKATLTEGPRDCKCTKVSNNEQRSNQQQLLASIMR